MTMFSLPTKEQAQALWSVNGFMWRRVRLRGGLAGETELAAPAGCGRAGIRRQRGQGLLPPAPPRWGGRQGGSVLPLSMQLLHPSMWNCTSPDSPPWQRAWGTARAGAGRGECPLSSLMDPRGCGGQGGGAGGIVGHWDAPSPFIPEAHRVMGLEGSWVLGKNVPAAGIES